VNSTEILIQKLIKEHDHKKRHKIRNDIAKKKNIDTLIKHTTNQNDSIRWEAVNLLGQLEDPKAISSLVKVVLNDDNVHPRWRSIWAITKFNHNVVEKKLLRYLKGRNKKQQRNAAVGLSIFGNKAALPYLLNGLDNNDSWIRWESLNAIRSIKAKGIESKIARFLAKKYPRSIRQEAVLTLGSFDSKKSVSYLSKAILDQDPQVRWRASMVLSRSHQSNAKSIIKKAFSKEKDKQVRIQMKKDMR